MDAPLKGIRIIDWTIWQQGPVATTMLADMGAEVIKIEERDKGDPGRGIMSMGGASATAKASQLYFEANNRHKQSLTLDLPSPKRERSFTSWPRKATSSCRISARAWRVVWVSVTRTEGAKSQNHLRELVGLWTEGPDSGEPSFDYLAQARSGIMNIAGRHRG